MSLDEIVGCASVHHMSTVKSILEPMSCSNEGIKTELC